MKPRPRPLGGEADGADAETGQQPELDRLVATDARGDQLDDRRLGEVEREVQRRVAEQRRHEQRQRPAHEDEEQRGSERGAGAGPDPNGDERDARGEHQQDRVEHQPELRDGEVELALEGREADQEGAAEQHLHEADVA
jgi:hypothetical protein